MKTAPEVIDILFDLLKNVPVSGSVRKLKRDVNSTKEDIVINALPVTGNMIQRGTLNVNIHVPDLTVNMGGQVQSHPDFTRLTELARTVTDILKDFYHETYNIWIGNQSILDEPNSHYVNLKIEFRNVNTQ
jgi:hypothetical protein